MSDQQDSAASQASGSSPVNVQQLKSQLVARFQANRQLVLKLHSILTWEQDIYPVFVVAFVSLSFLIVHLLNSSVLTTLSYVGIAAALLDMAMPTIAKNLSAGQAKASDKDNQRLEKICTDLAKVYAFMRSACDSCSSLKARKPKLYYPALLAALLLSAYVGNKLNNLFLTYLLALLIALYPGLDRRGYTQKAIEFVYLKLGRRPPSFANAPSADRRSSGGKRNQ